MRQMLYCEECEMCRPIDRTDYIKHKRTIEKYNMCYHCWSKLKEESILKMEQRMLWGVNPNLNKNEHKVFETGAKRDRAQGKGRYDLLSPVAIHRIAKRSEFGEMKYGDGRNWEKGMPISEFIDSALRHIFQYMDGDIQEDHLAAAAWNLNCAMHLEEKMPHMQNIPSRQKTLQSKEEEID